MANGWWYCHVRSRGFAFGRRDYIWQLCRGRRGWHRLVATAVVRGDSVADMAWMVVVGWKRYGYRRSRGQSCSGKRSFAQLTRLQDLLEKAEKKKRKSAQRAARRRADHASGRKKTSVAGIVDAGTASMAGFTSSMAGILRASSSNFTRRRKASNLQVDEEDPSIELEVIGSDGSRRPSEAQNQQSSSLSPPSRVEFSSDTADNAEGRGRKASTVSESSSTSATPSLHRPGSLGQLLAFPTSWLQIYLRQIRRAHQEATKQQVLERADKRRQVLETPAGQGRQSTRGALVNDGDLGWGLGHYGIREHQESARRLDVARERLQQDRLLPTTSEELGPLDPADSGPCTGPGTLQGRTGGDSGQWEDVEGETTSPRKVNGSSAKTRRGKVHSQPPGQGTRGTGNAGAGGGSGWSWWGPLRDWRLSDRSQF